MIASSSQPEDLESIEIKNYCIWEADVNYSLRHEMARQGCWRER
jgi:hypothetical protein